MLFRSEATLLEAIRVAHDAIKVQCKAQMELAEEVGSTVKREYCHEVNDEALRQDVHDKCYDKAYAIAKQGNADKHWRQDSFDAICQEYIDSLPEEEREEKEPMVKRYYHDVEKEAMRRCVLDEGIRLDGRKTNEIRPIWCEVDYLPGPHGSAVFTRGETQALATVTSAPSSTRSSSTTSSIRATSVSCSTITSPRSRQAKPAPRAE